MNRITEKVGLIIEFVERIENRRNSDVIKKYCVVRVIDESPCGIDVIEEFIYPTWENLKNKYPTLKDFLYSLFESHNWNASWRNGVDRALYIKEIIDYDGLYNDTSVVVSYFDYIKMNNGNK